MELAAIGILVEHPHLFARADEEDVHSLLTNPLLRATYLTSAEMQRASGRVETARLLQLADPRVRGGLAEVLLTGRYAGEVDATRALDHCIAALRLRRLERERQEIREEIARARAQGDVEAERALAVRFIEVGREMQRQGSLRRGAPGA